MPLCSYSCARTPALSHTLTLCLYLPGGFTVSWQADKRIRGTPAGLRAARPLVRPKWPEDKEEEGSEQELARRVDGPPRIYPLTQRLRAFSPLPELVC